jgi:hypothetical protein
MEIVFASRTTSRRVVPTGGSSQVQPRDNSLCLRRDLQSIVIPIASSIAVAKGGPAFAFELVHRTYHLRQRWPLPQLPQAALFAHVAPQPPPDLPQKFCAAQDHLRTAPGAGSCVKYYRLAEQFGAGDLIAPSGNRPVAPDVRRIPQDVHRWGTDVLPTPRHSTPPDSGLGSSVMPCVPRDPGCCSAIRAILPRILPH